MVLHILIVLGQQAGRQNILDGKIKGIGSFIS
jgi:hypothetical protein